ncbi:uncharacterized protein LOC142768890 isoform X2 [Rhipicephalus microplus]|uniref:uncharacterized protein LOC142768890 isoform X2 n=1 Tax=Rhipicephalus microplus TaxID=6941 RepID=UPI003F6D34D3
MASGDATEYSSEELMLFLREADAAVLRRMLSTKRPVRELTIFCISMAAFKVAFDKLEECLNLKNAYFFDVDFEGEDIGTTLSVAFQSLHTLELRCVNTGPGFARDVADYIRQNKSLRDLQLLDSCGGDEGAAVLIEALAVNDTLKRFSLLRMRLSSGLLIIIAEMLATNSMLEAVSITSVCPVEKDKVYWLLAQHWYARVFRRLDIIWPEELLPQLKMLILEDACYPVLAISITNSVDKRLLSELFLAVGVRKKVEGLRFTAIGFVDTFDELAEGIASLVKYTKTLQVINSFRHVNIGEEHQILFVLDALKRNSSVKEFTMYVEYVTPEIAASLSELFQMNNTLTSVDICGLDCEIGSSEVETILRGLRTNYTLTELQLSDQLDEPEELKEMAEILARNVCLKNHAAEFGISGAPSSNEEGMNRLTKMYSNAAVVKRAQQLTEQTARAVIEEMWSIIEQLNS